MRIWSMLLRSFTRQSNDDASERRDTPRRELTVLCTTAFRLNEKDRRAILLDLSSTGAKFGTATATGTLTLSRNQVLDFDLITPLGVSSCKGRVVWTEDDDMLYTWGVEFVDNNQENTTLVRSLLG